MKTRIISTLCFVLLCQNIDVLFSRNRVNRLLVYSQQQHLLPDIVQVLRSLSYYYEDDAFLITETSLSNLDCVGTPDSILQKLNSLRNHVIIGEKNFQKKIEDTIGETQSHQFKEHILEHSTYLPDYFSNITVLNALFLSDEYKFKVEKIATDYAKLAGLFEKLANQKSLSKNDIKNAESIVKDLETFNSYMHIQSEPIGHFIEFRIFFTEDLRFEGQRPYLFNKRTSYFGFTVDLESKDFLEDLRYCLMKNIPNSMPKPKFEIEVTGFALMKDGEYQFGVNDKITLKLKHNLINSDYSTQEWDVISASRKEVINGFREGGFFQEIRISQPGDYKISCSLSDLINEPVKSSVRLKVIPKPELVIQKSMLSTSSFSIPFRWYSATGDTLLFVTAKKVKGPRTEYERPTFKDSTLYTKERDILYNPKVKPLGYLSVSSLKQLGEYKLDIIGSDGAFYSEPQTITLRRVRKRWYQFGYFSLKSLKNNEDNESVSLSTISFMPFPVPVLEPIHFYLFDFAPITFIVQPNTRDVMKLDPDNGTTSLVRDDFTEIFLSLNIPLHIFFNLYNELRFPFYFKNFEMEIYSPVWLYNNSSFEDSFRAGTGIEMTLWYNRLLYGTIGIYIDGEDPPNTYRSLGLGIDMINVLSTITNRFLKQDLIDLLKLMFKTKKDSKQDTH